MWAYRSDVKFLKFGAWSWTWLFLNKNERMKNYILADLIKKSSILFGHTARPN
ncbi:hypothetical protein GCM10026983_06560 [Gracilibacillus alcaliphilus]